MSKSRRSVANEQPRAEDAYSQACNRPRMIGDPIGGIFEKALRRRGRRGRWRYLKSTEPLQGCRHRLRTMSEDILPEPMDGLGNPWEIGGGSGERGYDELFDALEVVFDLLYRGEHGGHRR